MAALVLRWLSQAPPIATDWVTLLQESGYTPRTRGLLSRVGRAVSTSYLPRQIDGMLRVVTGFRQVARISVAPPCYRHAPWERGARSLAPQEGLSTF